MARKQADEGQEPDGRRRPLGRVERRFAVGVGASMVGLVCLQVVGQLFGMHIELPPVVYALLLGVFLSLLDVDIGRFFGRS